MAGVTGLEPAASGVTGRRSNQLSYTPEDAQFMIGVLACFWRGTTPKMRPHNRKAKKYQPRANATDRARLNAIHSPVIGSRLLGNKECLFVGKMVGGEGLEPPTYSV